MERINRREPRSMDKVISEFIRSMKLSSGLNEQRICAAWDAVSGYGQYTLSKYYRNGTLYCTMSSSLVRESLNRSKDRLVRQINDFLVADDLFVKDDPSVRMVSKIVLK